MNKRERSKLKYSKSFYFKLIFNTKTKDGFDEELGGGGGGGSGPSGGSQAQNYPRPSDYSNTNEGYGASSQYKQEPIDRPASSSNKKPTSPSHEKYPDAYHDQTNAPNAEACMRIFL